MAIFFHEEQIKYGLKGRQAIKSWLKSVLEKEKRNTGSINIILTTDENLREINRKYLSRDYCTDIIAFDYSQGQTVSGDLYISIHRVQENAKKYGAGDRKELMRVMVHGLLHLIGYKDSDEMERKKMRKMEDMYLDVLGRAD